MTKNGVQRNGNGGITLPEVTTTNRITFSEEEIQQSRRIIRPKTPGQEEYFEAIDQSIILFCNGVAGTGKTFLAIYKALELLQNGSMKKILLTRPTVECGRGLGFFPGEKDNKFHPYLRPFYDAFSELLHPKELNDYIEKKIIELEPLEYLRGANFHKTVLILDEAQNAHEEQIKMFMTRIGEYSKLIIAGDSSQSDLDPSKGQAFREVIRRFDSKPYIDGCRIVNLTKDDIVRNGIIRQILAKFGE